MTASRKTGHTGSRNPANKKPTSVSTWKKAAQAPPMELPSGNVMRIKKVGLQALMKTGVMPNSLMKISQEAIAKGEKGTPAGVEEEVLVDLVNDQKKVQEISDFMDQVMIMCAQEPTVHPVPGDNEERDDELLYIDEIDEEDKMFVFQVVTGGTTDIEAFRRETGATMASIRGRQDVELPSE